MNAEGGRIKYIAENESIFDFEKDIRRYNSKINKNSEEYIENYQKMSEMIDDLNAKLAESRWEGKESHVKRYKKSGHLLGTFFYFLLFILFLFLFC